MLETARLLLLPWRAEDAEAFRPIATDPEVMRYISGGKPWSAEQIAEFIQRQIAGLERNGFCLWRLFRKQQHERLIGFCGLQPWRDRPGLDIGYHGVIEIGWWLARDCWGQGFATEAARAALDFGFAQAGLEKIIAVTHRDNKPSQRVAARIGLAFERAVALEAIEIWVFAANKEQWARGPSEPRRQQSEPRASASGSSEWVNPPGTLDAKPGLEVTRLTLVSGPG